MKLEELKQAYARVPQSFHQMVASALSEAKRGENKERCTRVRFSALLAAAVLVLALIGGITAGAVLDLGALSRKREEPTFRDARVMMRAAKLGEVDGYTSVHGSVVLDEAGTLLKFEGGETPAPAYAKLCLTLPEGYTPGNPYK